MELHKVVKQISLLHSTSTETPTDFELAQKLVNDLPIDWSNPNLKFLDLCCGRGNELLACIEKLQKFHSNEKIATMIYGCDLDFVQSSIAKKALKLALGVEPNIYCEDSLSRIWDMKFDVIVGNPPYQNTHGAKRWPIWHEFVKKSIELSPLVALIVPSSIISPGTIFDEVKDHLVYLNLDIKKYFNVGSTFCYFIYDKNHTGDTTIVADGVEHKLDLKNYSFLPPVINEKTLAMGSKLNGKRVWKRGEFHTSNKSWQNDNGVNVYHTVAQVLKTQTHHKNMDKIRVGVSLSGYPKFHVVQNEGMSQAYFWTEFKTVEEAQQFADYCNSEEIQEVLNTYKWSGWNSKEVIQKI